VYILSLGEKKPINFPPILQNIQVNSSQLCYIASVSHDMFFSNEKSLDEWIKKMWYLYTMEFYAAMKKNEMLSFADKWMELENIILSEVSLAQKTKNRMFSLICGH
jgi:hypothetical protein